MAQKIASQRYQDPSEEEKNRQYGQKRYKNLPKDKRQRLVEYRKNITKYGKYKFCISL